MVVDYLIKPVSPANLVNQIESLIDDCRIRGLDTIRAENMAREPVTSW